MTDYAYDWRNANIFYLTAVCFPRSHWGITHNKKGIVLPWQINCMKNPDFPNPCLHVDFKKHILLELKDN